MPSLQEGPVPSTSERTPMTPTNTCDYLNRNGLSQNGYGRGGLVEQDILNFFILDVDIFNLKNLYASVRQKRTKVTKETIQTFGHSRTNNNKNNIHNTNNKNTEQAKTCKILNRTHSKGNVPKTTTQRSHNHHNEVIYEYQTKDTHKSITEKH